MEKSRQNEIIQSTCHYSARWKTLKKGDKLKGSKLQLENGRIIESNFRVGKLEGDGEGLQRGSVLMERCWFGVHHEGKQVSTVAASDIVGDVVANSSASDEASTDPLPPPNEDSVDFSSLRNYLASDLTAKVYYNPHDDTQKPLALTIMGIGLPGFPKDVEKEEDVERATGRTKGAVFKKTDILPTANRSKKPLQKEVIRRLIVHGCDPNKDPRISNWGIAKLIQHLEKNPASELEHDIILEFWKQLKTKMCPLHGSLPLHFCIYSSFGQTLGVYVASRPTRSFQGTKSSKASPCY